MKRSKRNGAPTRTAEEIVRRYHEALAMPDHVRWQALSNECPPSGLSTRGSAPVPAAARKPGEILQIVEAMTLALGGQDKRRRRPEYEGEMKKFAADRRREFERLAREDLGKPVTAKPPEGLLNIGDLADDIKRSFRRAFVDSKDSRLGAKVRGAWKNRILDPVEKKQAEQKKRLFETAREMALRGCKISEIKTTTGIPRTTLYNHGLHRLRKKIRPKIPT